MYLYLFIIHVHPIYIYSVMCNSDQMEKMSIGTVFMEILLRVNEPNELPISSYIWSPRRHSCNSKAFKKSEKTEIKSSNHFRTN